jgi:hypothetical protein
MINAKEARLIAKENEMNISPLSIIEELNECIDAFCSSGLYKALITDPVLLAKINLDRKQIISTLQSEGYKVSTILLASSKLIAIQIEW